MNGRLEQRQLRKRMSVWGWALMIYYLLMNFCVTTVMEMDVVYQSLQSVIRGDSWYDFYNGVDLEAVSANAWGYLVACGFGVGLAALWKGKAFFREMWNTHGRMTLGAFLCLTCLMLSGQAAFQLGANFQEWVLSHFGLSLLESLENATIQADSLSLFLYAGLFAPVVEEILFRGVLLRSMMPYGKRFAVVLSAAMFGLFHGNLIQSPYAFAVGLVLGYTAVEYNILWSMVLHMINNLVLGDMLSRLTASLPGELASNILWGIIGFCALASVVILVVKRRDVWAYHKENRIEWKHLRAFVTAPGIIVLFVVMYAGAFWMLTF